MIEIVDRQTKIEMETDDFSVFASETQKAIPESQNKPFVIVFVSNQEIKELNQQFRDKNSATDILSFPSEADEFDERDYLGDIVISVEQAEKQAEENGLRLNVEIKQLILHGILHLCGYDHETDDGEMNTLELQLRDKLKIS